MARLFSLMTAVLIATATLTVLPAGATDLDDELRETFILANTEFTIFHEIGHAAIHQFDIPVLGLEEDTADFVAAMSMIYGHRVEADVRQAELLLMAAEIWIAEWRGQGNYSADRHAYWDVHSLAIQRFYNIVCLVYGSNPEALPDLLDTEALPAERGFVCEKMYEQARRSMQWVLETYGRDEDRRNPGFGIVIEFEEPATDVQREMMRLLKRSTMVSRLATDISARLAWPQDILLRFARCPGNPDAYYNGRVAEVTICYELLDHFGKTMDEQGSEMVERVCANPAIRRLFGDRAGCT